MTTGHVPAPDLFDSFDGDLPGDEGPPRRGFWRRQAQYLPATVLFVAGLATWELVVRVFGIEEFLLPRPSVIASTFADEFSTVVSAGWATFKEALGGFVAGAAAGVFVALAGARWAGIRDGALPFAIAANSAPIIAVAPIMNVWFGITNPISKMVVVAIIVFFPVMINTTRGLTEVDPAEIELLRSYAAPPREILRKVRLPNALPYLFSALKVASALAVIAAIVAEYFGGPRNTLGVYITQEAALFHLAEAWSAIIIGTIMGVGFYVVVLVAERLLMPWHVSFRAES